MVAVAHHESLTSHCQRRSSNDRDSSSSCYRCFNKFFKLLINIVVVFSLINLSLCTKDVEINSDVSSRISKRDVSDERRIVCYYTNWSVYRPGTAKYSPQNINPYLCTHLIYAFGGLDRENGLRPFDKYQDIEQGGYAKFTGLKTYNKALKTMLAIGGWNEGSARFSPLVADQSRRKEFVINVIKFLRQNHFDGLDLDWEYPAFRDGGKSRDRDNYAQLVQELREEFDRESNKTGRSRLLLTMAVPAGIEYIDKGYDIPKLNRYLDFMNILSYDYHSAFEPAVNHHSPLYSLEEDSEYNFDAQLSIDYTIKHYLESGADRDKLVLGIPTYGRSYTLFNPDSNEIGAPADGPGEQGDATREKGYLAYYEICSNIKSDNSWTVEHPKRSAMGPYAFKGNQWVGYDDVDIVKEKAKYVNENKLGGIMFWSIDNDDFRGTCHDRQYPLIEAGKEAMVGTGTGSNKKVNKNTISTTSTDEIRSNRPSSLSSLSRRPSKPTKLKSSSQRGGSLSTTQRSFVQATTATTTVSNSHTTPEPPTTPDPGSDFVCKDEGFFPHPRDCKKYFWCLDSGPSNLGIVAHQFTCPSGLFFNKAADSCDFARNVLCKEKKEPKSTSTTSTTTPSTPTTTVGLRSKVTAATARSTGIRYTVTTTTTTSTTPTPIIEEEEEEDDYDHAEEDPQAIKQLISLIKKLGGIAELEKQLGNTGVEDGSSDVKPPSISRNLYNRVLTTGKYQSPHRNGPSGPQNEGLSQSYGGEADDETSHRRGKPQYVTITRERSSTDSPQVEAPSDEGRPQFTYKTLNRNKPITEELDDVEGESRPETVKPGLPKYKVIERQRPKHQNIEDSDDSNGSGVRPKYTSIQRSRSTTTNAASVADTHQTTTSRYVTLYRGSVENTDTQAVEDTSSSSSTPFFRKKDDKFSEQNNHRTKQITAYNTDNENINGGGDESQNTNEEQTSSSRPFKKVSGEDTVTPIEIADINSILTTVTTPFAMDDIRYSSGNVVTTTKFPSVSKTDLDRLFSITGNEVVTTPVITVPYRTSTITSVVTMVMEGATERQIVPLSQLEKVLADHDLNVRDHKLSQSPLAFERNLNNKTTFTHSKNKYNNGNNNSNFNDSISINTNTSSAQIFNRRSNRHQNKQQTSLNSLRNNNLAETTTKLIPNYLTNSRRQKYKKLPESSTKSSVTNADDENVLLRQNQENFGNQRRFTPPSVRTRSRSYSPKTTEVTPTFNHSETPYVESSTVPGHKDRRRNRPYSIDRYGASNHISTTPSLFHFENDGGQNSTGSNISRPLDRVLSRRINRFKTLGGSNEPSVTPTTVKSRGRFRSGTKFSPSVLNGDTETVTQTINKTNETPKSRYLIRQNRLGKVADHDKHTNTKIDSERVPLKEDTSELLIPVENMNVILESNDTETKNNSFEKSYLKSDVHLTDVPNITTEGDSLIDQLQSSQEEIKNVAIESFNSYDRDGYNLQNRNHGENNNTAVNARTRKTKLIKVRLCSDSRNNSRSVDVQGRLGFDRLGNRCLLRNGENGATNVGNRTDAKKESNGISNASANSTIARGQTKYFNDLSVIAPPDTVTTAFKADNRYESVTSNDDLFRRNKQNRKASTTNTKQSSPEVLRQQHSRNTHRLAIVSRDNNNVTTQNINDISSENIRVVKRRRKLSQSTNTDTNPNPPDIRRRNKNSNIDADGIDRFSDRPQPQPRSNTVRRGSKKFIDTDVSSEYVNSLLTDNIEVKEANNTSRNALRHVAIRNKINETNKRSRGKPDSVQTESSKQNGDNIGRRKAITKQEKFYNDEIRSDNNEGKRSRNVKRVTNRNRVYNSATADRDYLPDDIIYHKENVRSIVNDDLEISHSQYKSTNIKTLNERAPDKVYRGSKRVKDLVIGEDYVEEIDRSDKLNVEYKYNDDYSDFLQTERYRTRRINEQDNVNELLNRHHVADRNELTKKEVNRSRGPVKRPVSRNRSNDSQSINSDDTTNGVSTTLRSQGKFLRRRVNKYRIDGSRSDATVNANDDGPDFLPTVQSLTGRNSESSTSTAVTKKFEFPKRTARPSTSLQQPLASPLQRATTELNERNPNSDSQIVESKEDLAMTEDGGAATLPDLANVAVAAIQSLATIPPPPPPPSFETTTFSSLLTSHRKAPHSTPVISVISTTLPNTIKVTPVLFSRGTPRPFSKKRITQQTTLPTLRLSTPKPSLITKTKSSIRPVSTYEPEYDADYYSSDSVDVPLSGKVRIHNDGYIECLDIGNFPHPFSCKKFISCAKMENDHLLGWEYTCPRGLSFDPVGGICNWSAGLGCKE